MALVWTPEGAHGVGLYIVLAPQVVPHQGDQALGAKLGKGHPRPIKNNKDSWISPDSIQ